MDNLDASIHKATDELFAENPMNEEIVEVEEQTTPQKVDIYQQNVNKRKDFVDKPKAHGATTLLSEAAAEVLPELAHAHKRAEVDSDFYRERGEEDRAQMVKDQYIEEKFLPAVEMLIIASTPDEVLNARDILKQFDELSMEYGPGYTESYIRTAYSDQLGNATTGSDGYVKSQVQRLSYLAESDQIRAAYNLARKLKKEIDNGEHISDESDYEVITRVATIG